MNPSNPPPRPGGPGQNQLQVELPDDVAQGTYSNLMFITHSPSEFVLDFARALPGARKGKVYSRIVMTPQHAKALAEMLRRNLAGFEEKNGTIKLAGQPGESPTIGFAPTPADAPAVTPGGTPPPAETSGS